MSITTTDNVPDFAAPATELTPLIEFLWDEQTYYMSDYPAVDFTDFPPEIFEIQQGRTYYRNRRNGADNRFFYSAARYARSENDVTIEGDNATVTFKAEPSIDIDLGKALNAGAESMPAKIKLLSSLEPITQMHNQDFSRVRVNVYDYQPERDGLRHVFGGDITKTVQRVQGNSLVTEFEFEGIKKKFESTPVGLRLTTLCGWIYGDCNCAAPDKDEYHICNISEASNEETDLLVLNNIPPILADIGSNIDKKLFRGWIAKVLNPDPEYDEKGVLIENPVCVSGMRFQIKGVYPVNAGNIGIQTVQPWQNRLLPGDKVVVYNGCDKQIATCAAGHGNTDRFGGFGMFIPLYNPITEARQ